MKKGGSGVKIHDEPVTHIEAFSEALICLHFSLVWYSFKTKNTHQGHYIFFYNLPFSDISYYFHLLFMIFKPEIFHNVVLFTPSGTTEGDEEIKKGTICKNKGCRMVSAHQQNWKKGL